MKGARAARLALQAGSLGCVALLVATPALALEGFDYPKEAVLALTGLIALAAWLRERSAPRMLDLADALLWGAVALAVLSAALGGSGWIGLRGCALCAGAAATFTAARGVAREGGGEALLTTACAAAVLLAASVLLEAHGVVHLSVGTRSPGGLLGHRNFAAHLLALALPLLLRGLLLSPRRLLWSGGVVLVVAALVLTRCRTAWIGAALASVAFAAMAVRAGVARPRFAAAGLALAAGAALAVLVPNRLAWRSAHPFAETLGSLADLKSGSGAGRLQQYRTTLSMIAAHPLLGVGPGGWTIEYARYAPEGDATLQPMAL